MLKKSETIVREAAITDPTKQHRITFDATRDEVTVYVFLDDGGSFSHTFSLAEIPPEVASPENLASARAMTNALAAYGMQLSGFTQEPTP